MEEEPLQYIFFTFEYKNYDSGGDSFSKEENKSGINYLEPINKFVDQCEFLLYNF